jgi:hypothetical protein
MLSRQNTTGCFHGAIFDILRDGGFADHQGGDRYVSTATLLDPTPAESIYQQLIQDYPLHADTHRLLHVTGSQFAECLTGAADPIRLLFGKSKALFQDFYTNTPMSVAASKLLIAFLRSIFKIAREQNRSTSRTDSMPSSRPTASMLPRNLTVSCTNSRRLLRTGGFFALVEFATRLYWLDLVFGLVDGWWLFEDDGEHCTVNEAAWKA